MKTNLLNQILIILCISLYLSNYSMGQEFDSTQFNTNQELHNIFIQKHKKKKTAALILFGSGVAMFTGGAILATNEKEGMGWGVPSTEASTLLIIGSLSSLVSIPFFISASINKSKSELVFKSQTVTTRTHSLKKSTNWSVFITIPF